MSKKVLIQYVRDNKRKPIGVVVATDLGKVGWSLCHKDDKWDKNIALSTAINRADDINTEGPIPHTVRHIVHHMVDRAKRYYKNDD